MNRTKTTKNKENNKKKRRKLFALWLTLGCLAIAGTGVGVFFAVKSCPGPSPGPTPPVVKEYDVTVDNSTKETYKWEILVNGKTGTFKAKQTDTLDIKIYKREATESIPKKIMITYASGSKKPLSVTKVDDNTYQASFSMSSVTENFTISGEFGSVVIDPEEYVYYTDGQGDKWAVDDETLYATADQVVLFKLDDPTQTQLYDRDKFNMPLTVGSKIGEIYDGFLANCTGFNSKIDFQATRDPIAKIGKAFMLNCKIFEQEISLPTTVTEIGDYFMMDCAKFNNNSKTLSLDSVLTIRQGFLSGASKFNQPVSIASITRLEQNFLSDCETFNQNLTLPSSLTDFYATGFLNNCYNMQSTLTVNINASLLSESPYSCCSCDKSTAAEYNPGIKVSGSCKTQFVAKFPKLTGQLGFYRNLTVI